MTGHDWSRSHLSPFNHTFASKLAFHVNAIAKSANQVPSVAE